MIGDNQLLLNKAEMIKALQYYFEKQVFKKEKLPYVKDISEDKMNNNFIIRVSENEE